MEAAQVTLPCSEGDMTAMPGHMPVLTTIRPGVVRVVAGQEQTDYVVTHGFVEVTAESVSVIAEQAFTCAGVSRAELEVVLEAARQEAAGVEEEARDATEKFLSELVHLIDMMD